MIEMKEKNIYDLWLDSLWECAPRKKHLLIEKYGDSYHVWKEGKKDDNRTLSLYNKFI